MKTIYIAGFEASEESENASAGWEWRFDQSETDAIYEEWKNQKGGFYIYKGQLSVAEISTDDEIFDIVELHLHNNDFDLAFPEHRILV